MNVVSEENLESIEIYNIYGAKIYSNFKLQNQLSTEIDLGSNKKGVYIMLINSNGKLYNQKIILN
ncbi:MAG: T9SS type A sorting domain-containing protein [Saprospiraceae bacterium]|nr:T9SS type A sorting domain-containing protein [Candidatus Vicinibacter affinis]